MNKDVIYIDVEDDITAIIGKVKAAKQKIVALVPPKRVGVLQSAVNLRLLSRAAGHVDKRLVLITNNQALIALSAAAKIPVARNLQTKPELAEIPALEIDDGEDVIDGANLPVGELAQTADMPVVVPIVNNSRDAAVNAVEKEDAPTYAPPPVAGARAIKPKSKKGSKVPNFSTFRKRLFLIILGVVLLIGFLIWAIFFAPRATIVISANTASATVNEDVRLVTSGASSVEEGRLSALRQEQKQEITVEFAPTGTKQVGDRATGTMRITRTSVSSNATTVPAGTSFTSGGLAFVSTESATLSGTTIGPGGIVQDSATVRVQAAEIGDEYNLSARSYESSVSGTDAEGSAMNGGSSREVTIVSAEDVQRATDQLAAQTNDSVRGQLRDAFKDDAVVINESYRQDRGAVTASPAVDQEASGTATLRSEITYSLMAVLRSDLNDFLDTAFNMQLDDNDGQRLYENGSDAVVFSQFNVDQESPVVKLVANGEVGPDIDEVAIKKEAQGKRYGDIQTQIEMIQGVNDVDIKFWPFWVSSAPNDVNRIMIEFSLQNES